MPPPASSLDEIVARYRSGTVSAEIAALSLLIASEDVEAAAAAAAGVPELESLLRANTDGCSAIVRMLGHGLAAPAPVADPLAAIRGRFDRAVAESEEGSVAGYSLGSPEILAAATREVVEEIERHVALGPASRVVELGCGIGRFLAALAPRVAEVHGLDVSPAMVAVARRRCSGLANVAVGVASGRDLSPVADRWADLALAIDVLPYVVEAGLVEPVLDELARVLAPRGVAVLFNYSYRGDLARDRAEVAALAGARGLDVRVDGISPLRLWDGVLFVLSSP